MQRKKIKVTLKTYIFNLLFKGVVVLKKKYLLAVTGLCMLGCVGVSYAGVIVLEGNYQGKNLYVQNPFRSVGVGFCAYEVTVNGQVTTDEVNSSAFEIDFKNLNLKVGDKVVVKIEHQDDCTPKVLNPEVLKPKSTFNITAFTFDAPSSTLKWSAKDESGKLPYIVEQFRWNKWIKVGEVDGMGTADPHQYEFKVTPNSGKNSFRVKQVDYTGQPRLSNKLDYMSDQPAVSFSPEKVKDQIFFSAPTMYEIYDEYGNIVKRGFGKDVDASDLKKGVYYLNYDNNMGQFLKK